MPYRMSITQRKYNVIMFMKTEKILSSKNC